MQYKNRSYQQFQTFPIVHTAAVTIHRENEGMYNYMLINGQGESIIVKFNVQVIVFAALLFLLKEVEMSPNQIVCDSDSRVKLSVLNGLREHHVMKEIQVHELKTEVDEAQNKINEAESAMLKIKRKINTTRDEADQIKTWMENMTTPELEQLEELEICSEDGFVADCCEVNYL